LPVPASTVARFGAIAPPTERLMMAPPDEQGGFRITVLISFVEKKPLL
jgi:hypothetical protein